MYAVGLRLNRFTVARQGSAIRLVVAGIAADNTLATPRSWVIAKPYTYATVLRSVRLIFRPFGQSRLTMHALAIQSAKPISKSRLYPVGRYKRLSSSAIQKSGRQELKRFAPSSGLMAQRPLCGFKPNVIPSSIRPQRQEHTKKPRRLPGLRLSPSIQDSSDRKNVKTSKGEPSKETGR